MIGWIHRFTEMKPENNRCEMCGCIISYCIYMDKKWCRQCVKNYRQEKAILHRHYDKDYKESNKGRPSVESTE